MLLALACSQPPTALGPPADLTMVEEWLVHGPVLGAAPLDNHDLALSTGSQIGVLTPRGDLLWHGGEGELLDAARLGEDLVVATEGSLLAGQSLLSTSPLPLEGVFAVQSTDRDLYVSADALYRLRGSQLTRLTLDGQELGPEFAVGPSGGVWTLQDGRAVLYGKDLPAQDAEHVGVCQVVAGSEWAVWEDEDWTRYDLGREVDALDGPREATWASNDEELLYLDPQAYGRLPRPEGRIAIDPLGRVLVSDLDGLRRLSVGWPVAIVGVSEGQRLEADTTVYLAATLPDQVEWLEADIDGVAQPIEDAELLIRVADWADGAPHTLTVRAGYAEGEGEGSLSFRAVIVGDVTWTEHIEPLYSDNCALCHAGSTQTLLDTPEAWESEYDRIWAAVSEGRMPLARDPLTPAQLALLAGWADGGFQ